MHAEGQIDLVDPWGGKDLASSSTEKLSQWRKLKRVEYAGPGTIPGPSFHGSNPRRCMVFYVFAQTAKRRM